MRVVLSLLKHSVDWLVSRDSLLRAVHFFKIIRRDSPPSI
jgi:hypothetical protein